MATVLSTTGIVYNIEELIKTAKKEIVIISPYNKLSQNYLERLQTAKNKGVSITLCYGKKEIDADVFQKVSKLCKLFFYENLHAKCYYNENMMIIASMNLYEASEKNRELGVLINKDNDTEMYQNCKTECEDIIKNAIIVDKKGGIQKNEYIPFSKNDNKSHQNTNDEGYCIRCGIKIPFNIEAPFCKDCYKSWNRYGDETYEENYCHRCGKEHDTSMEKPVCYSCYKKLDSLYPF